MRRILLLSALLLLGCTCCMAQYNDYYNPYDYAVAAAETNEIYRLNNIRFDENALSRNPEAWAAYQDYLEINEYYANKSKTYNTVAWIGAGVACLSLIPLLVSGDSAGPGSDAALGWSAGLLSAGGIAAVVGYTGVAVQLREMRNNKKQFIYYLKTTNNGIGIVTIF